MTEKNGKKRQTVTIYGQQYTVVSDETENHVEEVAAYVNAKMKEMKRVNPFLDSTRLAVLTAVNIADDYIKIEKQQNENRKNEE